jgi:hypothetical protein
MYQETKDGNCDQRVIVAEETMYGEIWQCIVIPSNGVVDDIPVASNILQIQGYSGGE